MKRIFKQLLLIYIILVAVKILLSYFVKSPTIFADEYLYIKMARSFFYTGKFLIHGFPSTTYMPLYPVILSIGYFLKNMTTIYFSFKVINAILSTLIIFPTYFLVKEFLSKRKSIILTIILSISVNFVFSNYIIAENLFLPTFMFFIYFLYKGFKNNESESFIISGILLGLLFLTRINAVAFIPICLITYLLYKKEKKFANVIYHYLMSLIVVLPWIIRNILIFGFSIKGIFGDYTDNVVRVFRFDLFIWWFFAYIGYILLSTGILFGLYLFVGYKIKNDNFKLLYKISLTSILFLLLSTALAYSHVYEGYNFILGVAGRYICPVLPLVIILGYIIYQKFDFGLTKKIILLSSILLGFSAQFVITSNLFPLNNQSVTYLGILNYGLEYLTSSLGSFLIILILLITIPWILLLRINKRILINLICLLLILNSIFAYSIVVWNSNRWSNIEHAKIGKWFDEYDKGQSKILFDERDEGKLLREKQEGIYERFDKEQDPDKIISYISLWIKDEIIIGNVSNLKNYDYVFSTHKLNLELIKDFDGIKIYKVTS